MNTCKIEIFNDDGSLNQLQERHNYLVPAIDDIQKSMARLVFTYGGVNSPATFPTQGRLFDIFRYLILTNNSDAVDTSKSLFDSETIVGTAEKITGYSGTDPLRGTINLTETEVVNSQAKYVFDFGTDKANGTFQSIFFSESIDLSTIRAFNDTKKGIDSANTYIGICSDATYIYLLTTSTTIDRYLKSDYSFVDTITLGTAPTSTPRDICTDGTNFYMTISSAIYKCQLDGTFVAEYSAGTSNNGGITYRATDGLLYFMITSQLYTISTTGTGSTVVGSAGDAYTDLAISNDNEILGLSSTTLTKVDHSTASNEVYLTFYRTPYGIDNEDSTGLLAITGELQYSTNLTDFSSTENFGISQVITSERFNVSNRVRLDSPVTKNNTQTMKVTFTFDFS